MCTRVRDGLEVQREASWAWTPKCDLGVPGLPDVQKQVDEMRFSWPRWTGTLSLIGGTGKAGGLESLAARIGEAPGGKTVREAGQDVQASWMHAWRLGLGPVYPPNPPRARSEGPPADLGVRSALIS